MSLTKAIIIGGIAGIAVPFAVGTARVPAAALVATMSIGMPGGMALPWSWPAFCVVTLFAWGLFAAARA